MTNSQSDIDELKTLQREAAELQAERKRPRSTAASANEQGTTRAAEATGEEQVTSKPDTRAKRTVRKRSGSAVGSAAAKESGTAEGHEGTTPPPPISPDQVSAAEVPLPEADEAVRDLALQIESIAKEMEEAARERPALALLAAFTIGVVVGQLFSRR